MEQVAQLAQLLTATTVVQMWQNAINVLTRCTYTLTRPILKNVWYVLQDALTAVHRII